MTIENSVKRMEQALQILQNEISAVKKEDAQTDKVYSVPLYPYIPENEPMEWDNERIAGFVKMSMYGECALQNKHAIQVMTELVNVRALVLVLKEVLQKVDLMIDVEDFDADDVKNFIAGALK